jgi:pimeloyl-ACP methyl ester carboxylesterase
MSMAINTENVSLDGLEIRVARSVKPGAETVLLTSPMPESIYAFTPIWPQLTARYSVLAIDLPSLGGSTAVPEVLAPQPMGALILRLAHQLGIERAHGVGPDVGTTATLAAAAQEPDFFTSLTVGSGAAAYPLEVDGVLRDIIEAPSAENFRDLQIRDVVNSLYAAIPTYQPPKFVIEDYVASYPPDRWVQSLAYVRSYPHTLPQMQDLLGAIQTPVHVITGSSDPMVPVVNGETLAKKLPHSRLTVLDAGHMPWEETHERYAELLVDWIDGGYATV